MTAPDFLGIGAQRAGTSWLDALLRTHPRVWLPTRRKEPHYFDAYHDRGREWYASFFPPDEEAGRYDAIGEITPRYLFDPEVPARVAAELPDVKLVCILRDPVDRAHSQFGLAARDEGFAGSFEEFLEAYPDAIARGMYHEQLARWQEHFPPERFCLLVFEQVTWDPDAAVRALASFLELDPAGLRPEELAGRRINVGEPVRFRRSYALVRRLARRLRHHDLDAPVNLARRAAVARLFGRGPARKPLSPRDRARMWRWFSADVDDLARAHRLDLSDWGPER